MTGKTFGAGSGAEEGRTQYRLTLNSRTNMTPTPQDWQAWYANKSTKDLEIEAEERAEVEEDK